MIVKAPIDGIVYYGHSTRGKWSAVSVETLRRGATIMPNDVFMTVVQTRPLTIRTTVPESQLQRVRAGLQAVVQPVGFAGLKLSAVVQRVGAIPMGSSGFDCQLTVAGDGLNSAIVPGMNCEMKMIPYKKTDALTVPPKAVFTEDLIRPSNTSTCRARTASRRSELSRLASGTTSRSRCCRDWQKATRFCWKNPKKIDRKEPDVRTIAALCRIGRFRIAVGLASSRFCAYDNVRRAC